MIAVLFILIMALAILGVILFFIWNKKPIVDTPPPTVKPPDTPDTKPLTKLPDTPDIDKPDTKPPTKLPNTPDIDKPDTKPPTKKPDIDKPDTKPPTKKPDIDKPDTKPPTKKPVDINNCYYNAAYEDKDKMDKIDYIEKNVKGCYVLVEPDELNLDRIKKIQSQNNKIGCYMSVGTVEKNRSDFSKFKKGVDYANDNMIDWTDEYVIMGDANGNPTQNTVNLMKQRIDKLAGLNCDYIEFDNMDADQEEYTKKYKTKLTKDGMKKYTSGLCNYVHNHPKRKMKCIFKNENSSDYTQFDALQLEMRANEKPDWDSKMMKHFIDDKKPIWISQYGKANEDECNKSYGEIKQKYGDTFGMVCSVYGNDNKYYHYG